MQQPETAELTVQDRFLRSNRSADPEENALVEFVSRINSKHPFIEATVAKIGYPRWDKTVKRKRNVKTAVRVGTLSTNGGFLTAQEIVSDEYYVPFVRDSDNHVNAAMIITASPTDTTFRYLCDWQYKRQSNDINKITDNAENFAIFFMYLDKAVFDRTEFSITDTTIFRQNGHAPDRVTLMGSKVDSGVHANMQYVETCMDVKIWWYYCPYIARGGFCTGTNGTCDKCGDSCPLNMSADTFCWGDWVDTNTSGGDGSNGTDVGSVPPDPCDGSGSPQNVDGTNNPRSGGRVQVNTAQNCSSDPGWSPSPGGGTAATSYDPNNPFSYLDNKVDASDDPLIENGITVLDNTGGQTDPINSRIIARTTPRGNTEDLQHSTTEDPTGISPTWLLSESDNSLFQYMTGLFYDCTFFDNSLETVGYDMINKFRNKTGGTYSNTVLNDKVSQSSTLINFLKKFGAILNTTLLQNGNSINNISTIDLGLIRPVFNGLYNKFHGLQILINDTEYTEIQLDHFVLDPSTGSWTANVTVIIHDHFGLDKSDALKYQTYRTGFAAWWLLQHTRDYTPFETVVTVKKSISGHL